MKRIANLTLFLIIFAVTIKFLEAQAPAFKNKAEYDGYNAAYLEKDPAKKADLAAKFLADFAASDPSFRLNAYMMMAKGYLDSKNLPKAMDAADKIDEVLPATAADKKSVIYGYGMTAAQTADDMAKIIHFGDKVLALNPADANTLITLAGLIPERLPTDEAGKKAALDKAEGYATKALTEVGKIFGGAKPAAMSDADWNAQRATVMGGLHSNLGFVALNRQDYDKSAAEYTLAVKDTPKDGIAQFRLGLAFNGQAVTLSKAYSASIDEFNNASKGGADAAATAPLKAKTDELEAKLRAKRDEAIAALATAVAIGGPVQQPAMDQLKKLWTGTPEDLDKLIASKKG